MNPLESIVVAVDFSDCSRAALRQAARLALESGARLHALHVIEPGSVADIADRLHASQRDATGVACRQASSQMAGWLRESGTDAEMIVVVGTPLREVLTLMRTVSADLLVAGARGTTGRMLGAGKLAVQLVRKAPGKVLLASENGVNPFHKVVVGVDFSSTSGLAVEQARRLAAREGSEVRCLHVFKLPWHRVLHPHTATAAAGSEAQLRAVLQRRLEEFVEQHGGFNARCELFCWESHGQGIAQYAREIQADLVIVGTRGHATLRELLLGATAERLLSELPCSVLTVRLPEAESVGQNSGTVPLHHPSSVARAA